MVSGYVHVPHFRLSYRRQNWKLNACRSRKRQLEIIMDINWWKQLELNVLIF